MNTFDKMKQAQMVCVSTVAVMSLMACGDKAPTSGGSGTSVTSAIKQTLRAKPQPGYWQMSANDTRGRGVGMRFCLSPEDAERKETLVRNGPKHDCKVVLLNEGIDTVESEMTCVQNGQTETYKSRVYDISPTGWKLETTSTTSSKGSEPMRAEFKRLGECQKNADGSERSELIGPDGKVIDLSAFAGQHKRAK